MTKEEIQTKLATVFRNNQVLVPQKPEKLAEETLYYLKAWGVVKKVDKPLPNEILCEDGTLAWIEDLI